MNFCPPRFAYSVAEIPLTQFEPSLLFVKNSDMQFYSEKSSSVINSTNNNNVNDEEDDAPFYKNVVSAGRWVDLNIHTHIVLGGYAACLISMSFCIGIVLLPPGPTLKEGGALRYISEGLEIFCGWTAAIMGTCTMLILMCQLIACSYMRNGNAAFFAIGQAIAWNVVAGVSSTGWVAHYVALIVFLVSNLIFNRIASHDPSYGFLSFKVANVFSFLFSVFFIGVGLSAIICGIDSTEGATLRSIAVASEFVVMFTIVLQTICLVRALDSFHTIHLRFVHR